MPGVSLTEDDDPAREAARREAVLECLGRLFELRLDGAPVAAPGFDFGDDSQGSLPGLVAHLPVTGLAPGRHEVSVRRLKGKDDEGASDADEPVRIAFWR